MRLIARDEKDLEVVSAALQDALLTVGEMTYLPKQNRFAMVFNRFMWEEMGPKKLLGTQLYKRVKAGLHFDGVLNAAVQNILLERKEGVLNLLSIDFQPEDEGSGVIQLHFAGGGTVRLDVECLEASMQDLGEPWTTKNRPDHGD